MPATQERYKFRQVNLRELRKIYYARTATIGRRRGHAPSRWNRNQLIAALQQDDSARFDFFSVPPEIRKLIYEKMKEVYEQPGGWDPLWRPTLYPDLKNMRLTCRQANAEASGILYSDAVFKMRVRWQLGPGTHPGRYIWRKKYYYSNIKDNGDQAEAMEIPQSPILAYRKDPELSGLRYIVACEIRIDVVLVTDHNVHRNENLRQYLTERVERNFQRILSKTIMEVKGLSKHMKILKISWDAYSMNYNSDLLFRMGDLVLRALSAVPGKVHLDTERNWGPEAVRWELSD